MEIWYFYVMKRFVLFCMMVAALAWASPSIQFENNEKIQPGKVFGINLIYPIREVPQQAGKLEMVTENGFTLVRMDSTDKVIEQDFDDPFEAMFAQMRGRRGGSYKARVYNFKIKAPKKTGVYNLGEISWIIDGEKYTISRNMRIEIQRSYDDDALSVSLKPNKTTIYEGEQICLTLGFHTYEHFIGNLQALDMNTGNDFIVHRNDLSSMEFKPVENTRNEREASSKFAWVSPTKSGNLQIQPFKFKYTKAGEPKVVEEKKQMGGMSFSSRTVKQEPVETETSTAPIKITVKPLPEEGKPSDFSGMVGNYSFNAEFDKTNLKVGEALTLTLTLKGDGTPGTITEPKLPNFEDFRAVPPENDITKKISGQKVITTKTTRIFLYPKKKGEFTIPEISYSWFNPSKKKYETAKAGPWNIVVEKGEATNLPEAIFQPQVANSNPAGGPPVVQKKEIENLGSDIRFIHPVKNEASQKAPYKSIPFWIAFLAAIPAYFVTMFTVRLKRKRSNDSALVRRNKASKMLKNRFAKANEALSKGDAKALYAALENGLVDYLSDLTNAEFKGMTRPQMKDELQKRGVNQDVIANIDQWLEKCAFARFAPVNPSQSEQAQMLKDVEKLCENLKI